jgi:Cu/Ag efflux protein CusF
MDRRTLLLGLGLLAGCAKKALDKRYTLTGDVLAIDPQSHTASIKGDKIEGWMEAMTMEYPVPDISEFFKLTVGDRITATVFVGESAYHISEIKVIGKAGAAK